MKENIHPDYQKVTVTCACGNKFETSTTCEGKELKVDICNKWHPFFTGKQKIIDTSGRIEKFMKKISR